jgi:hypothetical protein
MTKPAKTQLNPTKSDDEKMEKAVAQNNKKL